MNLGENVDRPCHVDGCKCDDYFGNVCTGFGDEDPKCHVFNCRHSLSDHYPYATQTGRLSVTEPHPNNVPRTLFVNLYGGPGTGKSTTAALTFAQLKIGGFNAELITEFAKDLTWEGRERALKCQPYVWGKQLWRMERLNGEVEVAITDSPILLCAVYGEGYGDNFMAAVHDVYDRFNSLDIFLTRKAEHHPYNPKGRGQSEAEAMNLDARILQLLAQHVPNHITLEIEPEMGHVRHIEYLIDQKLRGNL